MLTRLLILASVLCLASSQASSGLPFTSIDRGAQSGIEEPKQVVVRTPAEWAALWKQHAPDRPRPSVDFTRTMVVGVFMGTRPTGGHAVAITRIDREGADLVVAYRERRPAASDIVTQVITMPYDLVTLDRSTARVRFVGAQ